MLALAACAFAALSVITLPGTAEEHEAATAAGTAASRSGAASTTVAPTSASSTTAAPPATSTTIAAPRSFTLLATGDLLSHSAVYEQAGAYAAAAGDAGGYDFRPMFTEVRGQVSAADLAICHLETMLSPDNSRLSSYPMFVIPNQMANAIADTGYDACSVASNHALDAGVSGMASTLDHLDAAGVRHAGGARSAAEDDTPSVYEVQGVAVGHLSYAYGFNGFEVPPSAPWVVNQIDPAAILAEAAAARAAGAEFVVLSMHWGLEYQSTPTSQQTTLAEQLLASPDIDLIIGHHAHVIQPIERVGDEVVVYGMGNFLSNQYERPPTQDGVMVTLTVSERPEGGFGVTAVTATPTVVERPSFRIGPATPTNHADSYARTAGVIGPVATLTTAAAPSPAPAPAPVPAPVPAP